MNITQITICLILLINTSNLKSQNYWRTGKTVEYDYNDDNYGRVYERVDTTNHDTIRYSSKSDRYVIKSSDNVTLVDGHMWGGMGTPCGCEPRPHGYWIERYRNGEYKSQGKFFCEKKVGTWVYYYDNGQISKIETFKQPYEKFASDLSEIIDTVLLKAFYLRDGAYLEYYPNGRLKVEGTYGIFEEYSKTDTIFGFNLETFATTIEVIEGEFWIPRSRKIRVWNYYDEQGKIVDHKIYPLYPKGNNIRSIDYTYYELMKRLYEEPKDKTLERNDK